MIIFIQSTSSRYDLSVDPYETVASVKERIYRREGIAPSQQDLVYNDLKLANAVFLSAYNVEDGSLLQLFANKSNTDLQPTHPAADFLSSNLQPKIAITLSPDVEGSASSSPDYSPSVAPLPDDETQTNSPRSNLLQRLESVTYPQHTDDINSSMTTKLPPCAYFKKGKCNFGSRCRFSHNNVTRENRKTMKPTSDSDNRNEKVGNRVSPHSVHPYNMFQLSSFSFTNLPDYQQQHNSSSSNRRTYSPDGNPSVRFVMRQEESKGIKRTIEDEPKKGTLQYAAKKLLEQRRNSSASPGFSPAQLAPSGAIASASSLEHVDPPISPSLISTGTNLSQHVRAAADTSSEQVGFQSLRTDKSRDRHGDGSITAVAAAPSFDDENVLEQLGEMRALWDQLGRKMENIYSMIAQRRQTQVVDGQPVCPSSSSCDGRKKRKTNDTRVHRTLDCRNTNATNSTAAAGNSVQELAKNEARHQEGSGNHCSSQASTNSSAVEDLDIFFT